MNQFLKREEANVKMCKKTWTGIYFTKEDAQNTIKQMQMCSTLLCTLEMLIKTTKGGYYTTSEKPTTQNSEK